MNFIQMLDHNTTHVRDLKYEIMSFSKVIDNYFNLNPQMIDRRNYLFKKTWGAKSNLFHKMRYENVILGITLYVINEFYDSFDIDRTIESNNVVSFTECTYNKNTVKANLIQVYRVYETIKDLIDQPY